MGVTVKNFGKTTAGVETQLYTIENRNGMKAGVTDFGAILVNLFVKGADGKKHVIEKSFFSRGNKIVVSGIRREDSFIAKKYSKTPWHLVELITDITPYGDIVTRGTRAGEEEE